MNELDTIKKFFLEHGGDYADAKQIGSLINNWRRRVVHVYNHPKYDNMVISVGRPFDGGPPIICEEERPAYAEVILKFPKVVTYN